VQEPEQRARSSLRRGLAVYLTFFLADAAVVSYLISAGLGGVRYVTLSVVGVVGLLLLYQVIQHVRDLDAPLAETTGAIARKWSRADLFIAMQGYYIAVDRAIFRLPSEEWVNLSVGTYVKVVHLPNTFGVVSVHELAEGEST
jgi:hypothetical protein